jgi:hypothetical protein|tara:strand:- start:358 stop:939 length:582 start_codon:yes stop_codon:yes gene_type:complete
MVIGDLAKKILWLWLLASATLTAQITSLESDPDKILMPIIRQPLGGALSTRNSQLGIEFTYGQLPAIGETLGMRVNRLEINPPVLRLTVGESFDMDQLVVRAYGVTGELIEGAPLRIELEVPVGLVDIGGLEQNSKNLNAIGPGIGRIWLESMLPSFSAEPFSLPIVLIVRVPDSPQFNPSLKVYENIPVLPE